MGFSSYDDFINQTTSNNKTNQWYFQKVSSNAGASTAGRWHEFLTANGIPSAVSFSGSAGVATSLSSSTAGAMTLIEGNVGPNTRHLTNMMAWTNSTTVSPASLILCDFLLYYPACVVTGSPTALNNSTTLPRYADGKGVMAIIAVQTALGAASPALTLTFTATNSAGTTSSQSATLTSPGNSAPISTLFANSGGGFLPIPAGNVGVTKIDSYTLGSGTTGTVAMILVKPLMQIPLGTTYLPSARDTVFQMPSFPEIEDGACLGFIGMVGGAMAASSHIGGFIKYAWG